VDGILKNARQVSGYRPERTSVVAIDEAMAVSLLKPRTERGVSAMIRCDWRAPSGPGRERIKLAADLLRRPSAACEVSDSLVAVHAIDEKVVYMICARSHNAKIGSKQTCQQIRPLESAARVGSLFCAAYSCCGLRHRYSPAEEKRSLRGRISPGQNCPRRAW